MFCPVSLHFRDNWKRKKKNVARTETCYICCKCFKECITLWIFSIYSRISRVFVCTSEYSREDDSESRTSVWKLSCQSNVTRAILYLVCFVCFMLRVLREYRIDIFTLNERTYRSCAICAKFEASRCFLKYFGNFSRRVLSPFRPLATRVENFLPQNCNIFSVLSVFNWNKIGETSNLLLSNSFYPVMSYRQV